MARHHVIISGTGRAGTTFLVQLLTALKLDTGFDNPKSAIDPNANAGMESDIRRANAPYIVKTPWLCDYLDDAIRVNQVVIDHAIIPMRDLFSAAESRRAVVRNAGRGAPPDKVLGGLMNTKVPEQTGVRPHPNALQPVFRHCEARYPCHHPSLPPPGKRARVPLQKAWFPVFRH